MKLHCLFVALAVPSLHHLRVVGGSPSKEGDRLSALPSEFGGPLGTTLMCLSSAVESPTQRQQSVLFNGPNARSQAREPPFPWELRGNTEWKVLYNH
jgi:hypothetical protein